MTLGQILPILLLVVMFYLLVLRPSRARQAKQRATMAQLAPGSRIVTTSGLLGTVTAVDGDEIELEISVGVRVRFVLAAVGRVLDPETASDASDELTSSV
ncbi:unannotated protein [freshwater metagenome]|uniref:Unannotated protein n=1 Tax=freshwater metagenome TaxID=449393 RepID=A0A6J7R713_9ZZZZ|nr:preprotein translocase subunit YajC [Actinomycetota bacterium]MSW36449.1 preprotein translocase subunit YajC [Actinomycetota bacterium]